MRLRGKSGNENARVLDILSTLGDGTSIVAKLGSVEDVRRGTDDDIFMKKVRAAIDNLHRELDESMAGMAKADREIKALVPKDMKGVRIGEADYDLPDGVLR